MSSEILGILLILSGSILGFVAFVMVLSQRGRLADMATRLEASGVALASLAAELRALRETGIEPRPVPSPAVIADEVIRPEPDPVVAEQIEPVEPTILAAIREVEPAEPAILATVPAIEPTPVAATETLEQKLANRWMLWAGAIALAMGGVFLMKFAIDQGWFGPTARTLMGFLSGCALMAGGEWLRRQPPQRALSALRPNYVPPALTAGGVSIAYTSAYAAFELYNLLPPLLAFIVLGVLSASAIFLALLQGPLVAVLGIVGGMVAPLLVTSEDPSIWGAYIYLTFLVAAGLAIVRFTQAWWLGLVTLAGTVVWLLLGLVTIAQPGDAAAIGAFLLAAAALNLFLPAPALVGEDPPVWKDVLEGNVAAPVVMAWLSMILFAVFVFALLRMDAYGSTSLVVLALFAILCIYTGHRTTLFDGLPVFAGALTILAIAAWHLPAIVPPGTLPDPVHPPQSEVFVHGYNAGPIMTPPLTSFLAITACFGALFGASGFSILWRAVRPAVWAAVGAVTPVLLLAVAYWRIEAFGIDFSWAAVAIALAAANVAAASQLRTRGDSPGFTIGVGAFAAAAVAAITLGAAMTLREAWLTVAFSLQLPALAWIGDRLGLKVLRPVAMVVAVAVLVRLVLNPEVLEYPATSTPILNWALYGFGIPAVAFLSAAGWFRRTADDMLVAVLEGGAILFTALLIAVEIHSVVVGPVTESGEGLLEPSLRTIAWLVMAVGMARNIWWENRPIFIWGRNILAGGAVLQIIAFQVLSGNPLWSDVPVGTLPIFNHLLLAYGIPAALILMFVRTGLRQPLLLQAGRIFGLILVFINVTLEVRHHFHGTILSEGGVSDAEWYTYSAAWIALSGVLLALGIRGQSAALRYASLGVMVLTVGKVFLFDMAALTGLYRAASFAGLGLCLIAVGYLYQRFVFTIPPTSPQPADPKPADL